MLRLSICLGAAVCVLGCTDHLSVGDVDDAAVHFGIDAHVVEQPDTGVVEPPDAHVPRYVSARIEPADSTIDCTGTQPLTFYAVRDDGISEIMSPTWSVTWRALGAVGADGVYVPRAGCVASGRQNIHAELPDGLSADATVTVSHTVDPVVVGAISDPAGKFAGTAVSGTSSAIAYPLDGALMPNNVAPPDIQWGTGDVGDVYRVTIRNGSLSITAYVQHTGPGFRYDWVPSEELWDLVADNYDLGVQLAVDRWNLATGTVVLGTPISIRLTRSSISGNVYFWAIPHAHGTSAQLHRVNAGAGTREVVMDHPPGGCIGCHSISRDGRYIATNFSDGGGAWPIAAGSVFDLSTDLSVASPVGQFGLTGPRWWSDAAFNPDGTRLFFSNPALGMLDPTTGNPVSVTGLPAGGSYYSVDWAPDNSGVAAAQMDLSAVSAPSWLVTTHTDLVSIPIVGDDAFGPQVVLHRGDDLSGSPEGGHVDVHPTYSPDSRFIAFAHGDSTKSCPGTTFDDWNSSALYIMSRDGSGVERLDRALAGAHGARDYWPTFSPFQSIEPDGTTYLWVAFTSGRTYGNAQAGNAAADPAWRQLWVTALQVPSAEFHGALTEDPSNVPYWLPGQAEDLNNLGARWAPLACRGSGDACTTDSQCCSGFCEGGTTCNTPPPESCHTNTSVLTTCSNDADCCAGFFCQGRGCEPLVI